MLDHFSCPVLVRRATGEMRLATGFGEALERLRIQLGTPIYLTCAFEIMTQALQEVRDGGAIAFDPFDMVVQGAAGNTGVMVTAIEGVVYGDMRDP